MKKVFSFTLIVLFILTLYSISFSEVEFLDVNNLIIYIDNEEYRGKRFLEDDRLYVELDDLQESLQIYSWVLHEGYREKVYVLYRGLSADYRDGVIRKEEKACVPLLTFCETIGYILNFDESNNILYIQNPSPYADNSFSAAAYDLNIGISTRDYPRTYASSHYYPYYPYFGARSYYPYSYYPYSGYSSSPYLYNQGYGLNPYPYGYNPDCPFGYDPYYRGYRPSWRNNNRF